MGGGNLSPSQASSRTGNDTLTDSYNTTTNNVKNFSNSGNTSKITLGKGGSLTTVGAPVFAFGTGTSPASASDVVGSSATPLVSGSNSPLSFVDWSTWLPYILLGGGLLLAAYFWKRG